MLNILTKFENNHYKIRLLFFMFLISFIFSFYGGHSIGYAEEQDEKLLFQNKNESVFVNEEIKFSLLVSCTEEKTISVQYPEDFKINIEKINEINKGTIEDEIKINQLEHRLSVIVKPYNVSELIIVGEFLDSGTASFYADNGKEKCEISFSIENKPDSSYPLIGNEETSLSSQEAIHSLQEDKEDIRNEEEDKTSNGITTYATLPSFDWNLLNSDGLDITTFTQVSQNTPVKLSGGIFDNQERNYYLFLGHYEGNYSYRTGAFEKKTDMSATMSKTTLEYRPILSPAVLGIKKQTGSEPSTKVVDYSYVNGPANLFDIGEMDTPNDIIKKSGLSTKDNYFSFMIAEYIKENELVAYGYLVRGDPSTNVQTDYQPVRIHGYVRDVKSGRVRYDVSFYNDQPTIKYYGLTYGLHIDIGGAHVKSKLFSNGDKGLYFDEENVPADGIGEKLYFHTKQYGNTNGPTSFKVGDIDGVYSVGYWSNIAKNRYWLYGSIDGYKKPYEQWDRIEPEGYQFPLKHPLFILRWDPISVSGFGVGMGSLNISIEENREVKPEVEKKYNNLTSQDDKNHIGDVLEFELNATNKKDAEAKWENVTITDKIPEDLTIDPNSFKLQQETKTTHLPESIYDKDTRTLKYGPFDLDPGSTVRLIFTAKITSGAGKTIINNMQAGNHLDTEKREDEVSIFVENVPIKFNLIQEVLHADGTKATSAKKGEQLTYRSTIKNPFSANDENKKYKTIQINSLPLDTNLEDVSEICFKESNGTKIAGAFSSYDPTNKFVFAALISNGDNSINAKQDIFMEYKVKIKSDVKNLTEIIGQSEASAVLTTGEILEKTLSNKVTTRIGGNLVFVSAPILLTYGQNMNIEEKDKNYSIQAKDSDLIVQDYRGEGSYWKLTAILKKDLTSETGHKLFNSLFYCINGKSELFSTNTSLLIKENKTENDAAINISRDWEGENSGPILKIKAGKAHAEKYAGSIQWTLQDVPENQE